MSQKPFSPGGNVGVLMPTGTTAEQPSSDATGKRTGLMRYNTDRKKWEYYGYHYDGTEDFIEFLTVRDTVSLSTLGTDLSTAITNLGTQQVNLHIDVAPSTLTGNITIPDNIIVFWDVACVLSGPFNVTFNCEIRAGNYLLFDTDVTVDGNTFIQMEWYGNAGDGPFSALTDSATPSVYGKSRVESGGTTTITDFSGGYSGQEIKFISAHNVTIQHGTIVMKSGVDYVTTPGDTLYVIKYSDGKWYEF